MTYQLTTSRYRYTENWKNDMAELNLPFEYSEGEWYLNGTGTIEINSLEELQAFIKKWGTVIIKKDTIEIYNDYRE